MMKFFINILSAIVLCIAMVGCNNDPYFEYNGESRVQFIYEETTDDYGNTYISDSTYLSLFEVPINQPTVDIWIKVRLVGNRLSKDMAYRVSLDKEKSSIVEGVDIVKLQETQSFRAGSFVDSIKITIDMVQARKSILNHFTLKIENGAELSLGLVENQIYKVGYTALRPRPDSWYLVSHILGDYHYMKYEKYIELSGTEDFGSQAVREFYIKKVREYFSENVIIDPISGERVTCE